MFDRFLCWIGWHDEDVFVDNEPSGFLHYEWFCRKCGKTLKSRTRSIK